MGRKRKRHGGSLRERLPSPEKVMREQLKAFRKKFGRDPLPHEPVFFDPNEDEPTPIRLEEVQEACMTLLQGAPPQIIYAYKKTGRILLEDLRDTYPPDAVAEFDAAIQEYFALERSGKLKDRQ
jgi:hypothetical protein